MNTHLFDKVKDSNPQDTIKQLESELAAVKAERDKLNTKIKQYKDALELAVRYNRKGELLNKLALALESDGE